MAQTERGIVYPDDYSKVADVPADMQAMAESIDDIIGTMEENVNEELENRVEKEEGKDLSSNDFDDTYKENVDDNTEARHTHSNKSILDLMTAYYTAEEKEKLAELENYDDTDLSERVTTAEGKIEDIEAEQTEQNTAITNNENNIEDLQVENARLKQTLVTTTGTGETITLNKTAELDFVVPPLPEGNTKQNTTEGIQRIDTNETINETTSSGVTYSLKNGVFKFNGTATGAFFVTLTNKVNLESGDYTFAPADESGSYTGTMGKYAYTNTNIIDGGQTKILINSSLNEDYNDVVLRFFIANGCSFNNYQFKINLVKGTYTSSTIPAWEPYTNGASPNPEYEQEVQVVKGDVEVLIQNKNFFNKNTVTRNKLIGRNGSLVDFEGVFTSDFIKVKPNVYYHVNEYISVIVGFDKNKNSLGYIRNGTGEYSFTTASDCEFVRVRNFDAIIDMEEAIEKAQLELGSTASPYTPHQEQTLPLTLGNIELCKIGDYKDYFYKDNSKWYLHKEIEKIVLDGVTNTLNYIKLSNTVDVGTKYINNILTPINHFSDVGKMLSSHFKAYPIDIIINNKLIGAAIRVDKIVVFSFGENENFDTTEKINNWLSTNNLTLFYALANPQDTEITDTTLISQLEAINSAISYEEQTNISGTSSGINPLFDVEAYQSTKLLLENALNRLELLES